MKKYLETTFENLIFGSRWIQLPIYLGLIAGLLVYSYKFFIELIHMVSHAQELSEEMVMLGLITLVDISMVANLIVMVVIGGYATFVSRLELDTHKDKPEWLDKIDAGTLKVKLAGSLIGISGIHLLKAFINIKDTEIVEVQYQIIIHVVFLFTTLLLALTESIMHKKH